MLSHFMLTQKHQTQTRLSQQSLSQRKVADIVIILSQY